MVMQAEPVFRAMNLCEKNPQQPGREKSPQMYLPDASGTGIPPDHGRGTGYGGRADFPLRSLRGD